MDNTLHDIVVGYAIVNAKLAEAQQQLAAASAELEQAKQRLAELEPESSKEDRQ